MTTIKPDSPVVRETGELYRGRPLVVELHPRYVLVYPKGQRRTNAYTTGYTAVFESAAKQYVRGLAESEGKG